MAKKRFIFYVLICICCSGFLSGCEPVEEGLHFLQDKLTELDIGTPEIVNTISNEKYAYNLLDDESKTVYDQIYSCIVDHDEGLPLSTRDVDKLSQAYEYIMCDHSEIFWVNGYRYEVYKSGDHITGIYFSPNYTMTPYERHKKQLSIDEVCDTWLAELDSEADDYSKSKYVYDKLIKEVDYDRSAPDHQNIISVFLNRSTVCQGYACAASYMFDKLGIKSTVITGIANNDSHAWNLISLDGDYYYFDVTWGNSLFQNTDNSEKMINYGFLNITSDELALTHTINDMLPVPECTAIKDNYFLREGLYFDTWDPQIAGNTIRDHYESGAQTISIKFSNEIAYDEAFEHLITEKHFSSYCRGAERIRYLDNRPKCVLTLDFRDTQ